jgi:DNA-binding NarL/FixJ family response regulator
MAERPIRVLLVDDHKVVLLGIAALFKTVPHIQVVGEAGSVAEAVAEARCRQPDVVLLDVRLPDGTGADACRQIRAERPDCGVVMLTSYSDEEAVIASITAGASGYLLKRTDPERLIEAVEAVARGDSLLDPATTQIALTWLRRIAAQTADDPGGTCAEDPLTALSDQERKILSLIAAGQTNRQIAAELSLAESTVKTYVSNILQKLHLVRRAQAAAFIARRQGVIRP